MEKNRTLLSCLFADHRTNHIVDMGKYGKTSISANCPCCTAARKKAGNNSNADGNVNALAFFFGAVSNKEIKAGYQKGEGGVEYLLIERTSKTTGESWRASVEYNNPKNELTIVTDAPDDETQDCKVIGISCGMMLVAGNAFQGVQQKYSVTIEEMTTGISMGNVMNVFDAFYYESKTLNMGFEFKRDETSVSLMFDRASAYDAVEVKDPIFKRFVGESKFPYVAQYATASASSSSTKKLSAEEELEKFYQDCLNGRYRNAAFSYFFDQANEVQSLIPPLENLKKYAPNPMFKTVLKICYATLCEACGVEYLGEKGRVKDFMSQMELIPNFQFFGPPGCGKSEMPNAIAAALGVPVYQFTVSGGFEETDFNIKNEFDEEGKIRPEKTSFRLGYENGGIIIMDEFNACRPDVSVALNGSLWSPYSLGSGTKQIHRSSRAMIFSTYNPGEEGTKDQNKSTVNRFQYEFKFEAFDDNFTMKVIQAQYGNLIDVYGKDAKTVKTVLGIYNSVVNSLRAEPAPVKGYASLLSYRNIKAVLNGYYRVGESLGNMLESAILNKVDGYLECGDPEEAERVRKTILEPVRDRTDGLKSTYLRKD